MTLVIAWSTEYIPLGAIVAMQEVRHPEVSALRLKERSKYTEQKLLYIATSIITINPQKHGTGGLTFPNRRKKVYSMIREWLACLCYHVLYGLFLLYISDGFLCGDKAKVVIGFSALSFLKLFERLTYEEDDE